VQWCVRMCVCVCVCVYTVCSVCSVYVVYVVCVRVHTFTACNSCLCVCPEILMQFFSLHFFGFLKKKDQGRGCG
jgi:hypothetical protein